MIFVVLEVFHFSKKKRHEKSGKKETTLPDPRFNDQLVTRFVNNLMWDGKKSTALKFL
jgi:ribosomal protein S7